LTFTHMKSEYCFLSTKIFISYKYNVRFMSKKSASESISQKMELVNKKVREINERRRGMKITRVEDDLDRQELKNYVRLLGLEPGDIKLESAESEAYVHKDAIFYATIAAEGLIELMLLFIAVSYILTPAATKLDYAIAAVLMGMFGYLAYVMYKYANGK
jgi:hypothetical protein